MATNLSRRSFIKWLSLVLAAGGCADSPANVVLYPAPVLRRKAAEVEQFGEKLSRICKRLEKTFHSMGAFGLAAPQLGESLRVIGVKHNYKLVLMVNPVITRASGTYMSEETCLSLPGTEPMKVKRYSDVVAQYLTPEGKRTQVSLRAHGAAILQHEIDHLDGILYIDRASGGPA